MPLDHLARGLDRLAHQLAIALQVGEAQQRLAALPLAQVFAGPPDLEVALRDDEAARVFEDHLEALARGLGQRLAVKENAHALARAPSDAPAQLVQLREPEALGA